MNIMRVGRYDNTNFGAILKFSPSIEMVDIYGIPSRVETSFVQIDSDNKFDIKALRDVAKYWKDNLYADNAYNTALMKFKQERNHKNYDVYALTFQKDNLERLDSDDIIGIVEVMNLEDKQVYIEHIEGKPVYVNEIHRQYNEIGTAMLDSLKEFYDKIVLVARRSKVVSKFYVKNGFIEKPVGSGLFIWVKDALLDLDTFFL